MMIYIEDLQEDMCLAMRRAIHARYRFRPWDDRAFLIAMKAAGDLIPSPDEMQAIAEASFGSTPFDRVRAEEYVASEIDFTVRDMLETLQEEGYFSGSFEAVISCSSRGIRLEDLVPVG